jgi:hypothetical protein
MMGLEGSGGDLVVGALLVAVPRQEFVQAFDGMIIPLR